jgi:methylenetetrahydrofolate reductase (NADPH)
MSDTHPNISFEFFPPKTEAMETALLRVASTLAPFQPAFVSVTYGAGGSTRDRTHRLVVHLQKELGLRAAAHLTCIGASRKEVDDIAAEYWQQGIRHLVALRGDPPEGDQSFRPHPDGYQHAVDLMTGLKRVAAFQISVAGYPEKHPEALNLAADLEHLKRKVDAGATRVLTQFFLDTDVFLRFRDRAVSMGIAVPVVPGILPIINFERACGMAQKCGVGIPDGVRKHFGNAVPGTPKYREASLSFALKQLDELLRGGVHDFHFFTLNKAELVVPMCQMLRPISKGAVYG